MLEIQYLKGDATNPQTAGNKVIVHICNDVGGWGKGFVLAISKRWKEPERKYREWYKSKEAFELGNVQFVAVKTDIWIANILGQHEMNKDEYGNPPIRYDAVSRGLEKVKAFALKNSASIHMPRIGCGLAGGTWDKIEPIILNKLCVDNLAVTVYDL